MNSVLALPVGFAVTDSAIACRRRLYGLGIVVALAFYVVGESLNNSHLWGNIYLPFVGLAALVMCIAGAEYQFYTVRVEQERVAHSVILQQTAERQRAFNRIWQALADHRGEAMMPDTVMSELAGLFRADMVAVWAASGAAGEFQLRGLCPVNAETGQRLDKVTRMSPCFEQLRQQLRVARVTDFAKQTTPALAWFCEDHHLQGALLCPVLVRHELVGVLAFFYRQKPAAPAVRAEEMQAAANLFLCAF